MIIYLDYSIINIERIENAAALRLMKRRSLPIRDPFFLEQNHQKIGLKWPVFPGCGKILGYYKHLFKGWLWKEKSKLLWRYICVWQL